MHRKLRVKIYFKSELKFELEYRLNRRTREEGNVMDAEYPSDDTYDSDYTIFEIPSDEKLEHEFCGSAKQDINEEIPLAETYDVTGLHRKLDILNAKIDEASKTAKGAEELGGYNDHGIVALINSE